MKTNLAVKSPRECPFRVAIFCTEPLRDGSSRNDSFSIFERYRKIFAEGFRLPVLVCVDTSQILQAEMSTISTREDYDLNSLYFGSGGTAFGDLV